MSKKKGLQIKMRLSEFENLFQGNFSHLCDAFEVIRFGERRLGQFTSELRTSRLKVPEASNALKMIVIWGLREEARVPFAVHEKRSIYWAECKIVCKDDLDCLRSLTLQIQDEVRRSKQSQLDIYLCSFDEEHQFVPVFIRERLPALDLERATLLHSQAEWLMKKPKSRTFLYPDMESGNDDLAFDLVNLNSAAAYSPIHPAMLKSTTTWTELCSAFLEWKNVCDSVSATFKLDHPFEDVSWNLPVEAGFHLTSDKVPDHLSLYDPEGRRNKV